jgi:hypothetical protein
VLGRPSSVRSGLTGNRQLTEAVERDFSAKEPVSLTRDRFLVKIQSWSKGWLPENGIKFY